MCVLLAELASLNNSIVVNDSTTASAAPAERRRPASALRSPPSLPRDILLLFLHYELLDHIIRGTLPAERSSAIMVVPFAGAHLPPQPEGETARGDLGTANHSSEKGKKTAESKTQATAPRQAAPAAARTAPHPCSASARDPYPRTPPPLCPPYPPAAPPSPAAAAGSPPSPPAAPCPPPRPPAPRGGPPRRLRRPAGPRRRARRRSRASPSSVGVVCFCCSGSTSAPGSPIASHRSHRNASPRRPQRRGEPSPSLEHNTLFESERR